MAQIKFTGFDQTKATVTAALVASAEHPGTLYFNGDGTIVINSQVYSDATVKGVYFNGSLAPVDPDHPGYLILPTAITPSDKGIANGVAPLDSVGKIPSTYLYSYVDDVIDIIGCYCYLDELYRPLDTNNKLKLNPTLSDFTSETKIAPTSQPGTYYMALDHSVGNSSPGIYHYVSGASWTREYGETGKIYIETSLNKQYRFAENDYTPREIVASPGTLDDITEGTVNKHFTATEKTKLSGIATGANNFNVNYDTTNKKLTKTSNGTTSDVVSAATLKTDMALNNVTNNKQIKAVSDSDIVEGHFVVFGINGETVEDAGFSDDVFEKIANKVTTVRDSSTASDGKYPSEKAVRTAIDSKKTAYADLESTLQGKIDTYDGHVNDTGSNTITPVTRGLYKIGVTEQGHVRTDTGNTPTAVVKSDLTGLGVEDASNKVTSVDNTSTDAQYPSAKCVYDMMADMASTIEGLISRIEELEAALTLEVSTGA